MAWDALASWNGSPAWAGIDLDQRERGRMVGRFPRVGGDRPDEREIGKE